MIAGAYSFTILPVAVVKVIACPDLDVLFQLLHNLLVNDRRCFWILYPVAEEYIQ
jgi:hypothetical protein